MITNESRFVYGACPTQTCALHGVVKHYPTRLVYVYNDIAVASTDIAMRCTSCDSFLVPQLKPDPKRELADSVSNYVETHRHWQVMNKKDAIRSAVELMCTDIGLAQHFLKVVGVEVDLYNQEKKSCCNGSKVRGPNNEGQMVCPFHCSKCGHGREFEDYLGFCAKCKPGEPCANGLG